MGKIFFEMIEKKPLNFDDLVLIMDDMNSSKPKFNISKLNQ